MKQHLRYCLITAFDQKETRHAQAVVKDLGIAHEKAVPQSIGDQWWFLNCEVPDGLTLPPYLEPMEMRPEQVTYWLSNGKEGRP